MFLALDRLSEDDAEAILPSEVPLYLSAPYGSVQVFGLREVYEVEEGTLSALGRLLQRYFDGLRNSEAAALLVKNHAAASRSKHCLSIKVPRAVADAILDYQ